MKKTIESKAIVEPVLSASSKATIERIETYFNQRDQLVAAMEGVKVSLAEFCRELEKSKGVQRKHMVEGVEAWLARTTKDRAASFRATLYANTKLVIKAGKISTRAQQGTDSKKAGGGNRKPSVQSKGVKAKADKANAEPGDALTFEGVRASTRILAKGRSEADRVSMALEMLTDLGLGNYTLISQDEVDASIADLMMTKPQAD